MSSSEFKKVPCGTNLKESKLSFQNIHKNSNTEIVPKIKDDSAEKKLKSSHSDCLESIESYILIENEPVLKKKLKTRKKSPMCSNIITRNQSKILKLKEVSNKNTSIYETNDHNAISTDFKSEIPGNLIKTQSEKKVKENELTHLNFFTPFKNECPAGLINAPRKKLKRESQSCQIEIITLDSPFTSENATADDLKQTETEKSVSSALTDPKEVPFEKTTLGKELLKASKTSAKKSKSFKVPEFEAESKEPNAEFDKTDYYNLLALNEVNLVQNVEQFKCPLCFMNVDVGKGAILQECLHSFCRECLAVAIQISKTAVVKCPFRNDEYSCEHYIQEREVKSIVTDKVYEHHLQRSVTLAECQAQNSFHCKTPECRFWCLLEDAVNSFLCPVCNHINCLICDAIHEGKNCIEYQDDLVFSFNSFEEASKTAEYQKEFHKVHELETVKREPEDKLEKKSDYQNLLILNDVNLVRNVGRFECPICFSDVDVGEGAILQECLHSFCRECLAGAIQFSETAVVKCPFRNDEYSCDSYLQDREVKSLVTSEVYEKHLQRSVALAENQAQNSFHCKTPDCPGWCLFEDDVNTFLCPVCNHINCLTCAAIHEGRNCKQYQDDLVFKCDSIEEARKTREYLQNKLDKGKAMKCPQCQIILMKKTGCDWCKCSMCHTEICWRTKGPRWGPRGFGDISGGCKCMLYGTLCHPDCKNCH